MFSCFLSVHLANSPLSLRERAGVREFSTEDCGFPHPDPLPEGEGTLGKEWIDSRAVSPLSKGRDRAERKIAQA